MKKLIRMWIVNSISLWVVDTFLSGISFSDGWAVVSTALALTLINMIIKPVLRVLSLPITILTFGLFSLVVNGAVLSMAFRFSSGSYLNGFGTAIIASIILALCNSVLESVLNKG